MFVMTNDEQQRGAPVIKVVGVGGGGGNALSHMINAKGVEGVEFICANTDAQALKKSACPNIIQLGEQMTKGLGAGADPEVGRQAAQEDREKIYSLIEGCDMLFITAGMGGGTGTGAAPVFAEIAKECGVLTVAVVTTPFSFEGNKRMRIANQGIAELAANVDSLITIPNTKLLKVHGKAVSLLDAFSSANEVLYGAVQGISELITRPGLINVDFADVRTVMSEMGMAMMGSGVAMGEERAQQAAELAIASPLLEDINLQGAQGVLVNVTAGLDLTIGEFEIVGNLVRSFTSDEATVVVGTVIDQELEDELRVTVVVTGLPGEEAGEKTRTTTTLARQLSISSAEPSRVSEPAAPVVEPKKVSVDTSEGGHDTVENRARSMSLPLQESEISYLDIPTFLRREQEEEGT